LDNIAEQPVLYIVIGLVAITLMVLVLPFRVKKIGEHLEPFFLVMGIIAVSVSGLWSWALVKDALKAPVIIRSIPIGIFQVVLIFGLLIHHFHTPFKNKIVSLAEKLGPKIFLFLFITLLGLISSVISVIVTAVILAEVVAVLPFSRRHKMRTIVVTCFAAGLGAVLTPVGEPLSTILVSKLTGPPYNAGFLFPVDIFGMYVIPGVIALGIFGAVYIGRDISLEKEIVYSTYTETVKGVIIRAVKVFIFVAALILLGEGMKPLIVWYLDKISPWALYWINTVSAFLDNATLTAVEIGPDMTRFQILSAIMGLLIAGGILIPGNIPNIVAAERLKIKMGEWARIGVPLGAAIMAIYFIVLIFTHTHV
jgi:predicted cation transporter